MDDLTPLPTTFDPDNDDFDVEDRRGLGHGGGEVDEDGEGDLLIVHGEEEEEEQEEGNEGEGEGEGEDQTNLMEYIASLQQIGEHDNDGNQDQDQDQDHDTETGDNTHEHGHDAEVELGQEMEEESTGQVVDTELGEADRNRDSPPDPNPDPNPDPITVPSYARLQSEQQGQESNVISGPMEVEMEEEELGESIEVDPGQEPGELHEPEPEPEPEPEIQREASSPLSDLPDLPDELEFSPPPSPGPFAPSRNGQRHRQPSSNSNNSNMGTGMDMEVDRDSSLTPLYDDYDHEGGGKDGVGLPRPRFRAESSAAGARRSASMSHANATKRGRNTTRNRDSRGREKQGRRSSLSFSSSPPLESIEVAPDIAPGTAGTLGAGRKKRQRERASKGKLPLRHGHERGDGLSDGEGDNEFELVPKSAKRSKSAHPFPASHAASHAASASHPPHHPSRKPLDPISTGLKLPGPRALPPSRPRALNDQSIKKFLVGKTEEVQLGICLRERYKKWGKCTQCVSKLGGDCCRFRDYRVFPINPKTTEITGPGYFKSTTWPEPLTPLPTKFTSPLDGDKVEEIQRTVAGVLLPLITGEARHCFWPFHLQGRGKRDGEGEEVSDPAHSTHRARNPITLHRGVDTALHRSVCDFCSSTIFGGYYFCKKCGRDYCLQCERYFPESMEAVGESPWELTDAARPRLLKCIKQPWEEMMSGGGGEMGGDSTGNGNGNGSTRTNTTNANTDGGSNTNKNGRKREKAIAWHVRSDLQPVSRFTKEEIEGHWLSLAEFVIGHGYGPDASSGSGSGFDFLFGADDGDEPEGEKKKEEWRLQWERMLRLMGLQMDEEVKSVLEQWSKNARVVREKESGSVTHLGPGANVESNLDTDTNSHPVNQPESSSNNPIDSQAPIDKTSTSVRRSAAMTTKNENDNKLEPEMDEVEELETGEPKSASEMLKGMMDKENGEETSAAHTGPAASLNSVASAPAAVRSSTQVTKVEIPVAANASPTVSSSSSPQANPPFEKSGLPSASPLRSVPTSGNFRTGSNPMPDQQQDLEKIAFSYTKHTHPNPPSDPASLSDYSLPFIYLPSPEGLDNKAFDELWSKGEPIVVGGVNVYVGGGGGRRRREEGEKMGKEGEEWGPEKFIERFGEEQCSVVDCQSDTPLVSTVGAFFAAFGESVGKPWEREGEDGKRKEKKRQGILKLKDWPPGDEFVDTHPELYHDFCAALPVPDYTRRDGVLNLYSHFPPGPTRPDIGPKMYAAFAALETPGGFGSTRLHMDVADAINIMLHASPIPDDSSSLEAPISSATCSTSPSSSPEITLGTDSKIPSRPGCAVWDIYPAQDADKIREFLKEKFDKTHNFVDPIHSQMFYLDAKSRKELWERKRVVSWRVYQYPGQAVFIPAGCAHQVCNLSDCIKMALDFVSPHNVPRCQQLTKDFRRENYLKAWKEDVLQLYNVLWYAWLSARETIARREKEVAAAEARQKQLQSFQLDDSNSPLFQSKHPTSSPLCSATPTITSTLDLDASSRMGYDRLNMGIGLGERGMGMGLGRVGMGSWGNVSSVRDEPPRGGPLLLMLNDESEKVSRGQLTEGEKSSEPVRGKGEDHEKSDQGKQLSSDPVSFASSLSNSYSLQLAKSLFTLSLQRDETNPSELFVPSAAAMNHRPRGPSLPDSHSSIAHPRTSSRAPSTHTMDNRSSQTSASVRTKDIKEKENKFTPPKKLKNPARPLRTSTLIKLGAKRMDEILELARGDLGEGESLSNALGGLGNFAELGTMESHGGMQGWAGLRAMSESVRSREDGDREGSPLVSINDVHNSNSSPNAETDTSTPPDDAIDRTDAEAAADIAAEILSMDIDHQEDETNIEDDGDLEGLRRIVERGILEQEQGQEQGQEQEREQEREQEDDERDNELGEEGREAIASIQRLQAVEEAEEEERERENLAKEEEREREMGRPEGVVINDDKEEGEGEEEEDEQADREKARQREEEEEEEIEGVDEDAEGEEFEEVSKMSVDFGMFI